MGQLSAHLWRIEDSCNVYLITGERGTVCVDLDTGRALAHPALGPRRGRSSCW